MPWMHGEYPAKAVKFDLPGFKRETGLHLMLARKAQRYTQEGLAKAIGISRANYASIEIGRQRAPVDVVWRVSRVLKVPLESLVPEATR